MCKNYCFTSTTATLPIAVATAVVTIVAAVATSSTIVSAATDPATNYLCGWSTTTVSASVTAIFICGKKIV